LGCIAKGSKVNSPVEERGAAILGGQYLDRIMAFVVMHNVDKSAGLRRARRNG
jgi:hypothetical protein